jgi:DNA-nicking Smr family endonuclease
MADRKKPSPEDIELFRRSVGPVRKINHDRVIHLHKTRPTRPQPRLWTEEASSTDRFSDYLAADSEVSSDENLFFTRPGIQQRKLQQLRRGRMAAGAELDMHGMTVAVARVELIQFIDHCREQHIRCVRIIHGKGYSTGGQAPVLKNRLNNWLRQHHDVLAFSSAPQNEGGSGAVNVLLRAAPPR